MSIVDIMNREVEEATREAEDIRRASATARGGWEKPLPDDDVWFADVLIGVVIGIVVVVAAVIYKVIH